MSITAMGIKPGNILDNLGQKDDNGIYPGSLKIEEEDRFLTTAEAANYLRVCAQSLLNMTSNGQVPVCKLGRRNRYRLQDLKDLLLTNRRGGL